LIRKSATLVGVWETCGTRDAQQQLKFLIVCRWQSPRAKKNHNIIITHADNCTKQTTTKSSARHSPLAESYARSLSLSLPLSRLPDVGFAFGDEMNSMSTSMLLSLSARVVLFKGHGQWTDGRAGGRSDGRTDSLRRV